MAKLQLRDYQKEVVNDTYAFIKGGKKHILNFCPTGSGKSVIIAQYVLHALEKGKRVLILVHRFKLAKQLYETIEKFSGHRSAFIAPGYRKDYYNIIQIAMVQTLVRRELPEDIDLVVADEGHITGYSKAYQNCLDAYALPYFAASKAIFITLSASPWRTSRKEGLCHFVQCVVKAPSTKRLVELGHLTKERIFTYDILDTDNMKVSDGDYSLADLKRTHNHEYNLNIFDNWKKKCSDRKTIVFCATVQQAKDITKVFADNGYTVDCITGNTKDNERDDIYHKLKTDVIKILVCVLTLTEGFDEPSIAAVVIARASISPALITQMRGRGSRLFDGKEDYITLDFGNCIQNLLKKGVKGRKIEDPNDIQYVRLCSMPPATALTKKCPDCGATIPQFAIICPECNTEFKKNIKAEKPNFNVFPDMVELLTGTNLEEFKYIRTTLKRLFNRNEPLNTKVLHQYKEKFDKLPEKDYAIGAIFNYHHNDLNMGIYQYYLSRSRMIPEMKKYFFELEFGVVDRTYTLPNGKQYLRKTTPKLLKPNEILDFSDLTKSYHDQLSPDNFVCLNYCYKLLKQYTADVK